ncbi:MAG: formate dehydrogenase accessory sulfurtransferase FdhD [Hyphomonadaceae bacterium]|nr:MAG: FdhD protein [Caulobacteraceae bacterium]MBT9447195.1 formate dehydrogenase accessory sulfurtransferase FdhD [Hyphomonadaceae bacterium]TPW08218.1 MAG: FdhD protein [Alphaproteobacteria bacterium]
MLTRPTQSRPARVLRHGAWSQDAREVIGEIPVALVVDGSSEAVMMATPGDLEDFALGFAFTEGLIATPDQVRSLEIVETELGIEARLWLHAGARRAHSERLRRRAGPVGCGLCGVESLEQAMRPLPAIASEARFSAHDILAAMGDLEVRQPLNRVTRAAHAAGLFVPGEGVTLAREDIGRHNAFDKLVGALLRAGESAHAGAVIVTSRISVELVQKAAIIGAPALAAISAPSTLAIDMAERVGLTLLGVVRTDGLEVFTCPERIE